LVTENSSPQASDESGTRSSSKRRGRGGKPRPQVDTVVAAQSETVTLPPEPVAAVDAVAPVTIVQEESGEKPNSRRRGRGAGKRAVVDAAVKPVAEEQSAVPVVAEVPAPVDQAVVGSETPSEKKSASRNRRPRKPKPVTESA
jgi:hypothetical protein